MKWWARMKRREIQELLPAVFQRAALPGSPLSAVLDAMDALHAPDEEVLRSLPSYFDPYNAPDELVPLLALWVDLGWLLSGPSGGPDPDDAPPLASGLGRLRELVAAAPHLARRRGTAQGLVRFLETATGIPGFEVDDQVPDDQGRLRPFHIRVRAPAAARTYQALVVQIVEIEKPAYVTCDPVQFG